MQLKKTRPIRKSLAMATATLLGSAGSVQAATTSTETWDIDTAVLFYTEQDRVSIAEPVVRARKDLGDDQYLNLRLVVDAMTGASANGAIPTSSAQTFTGPSGGGSYTVAANTIPLDPTFHDTRVALNGEWEKPLSQNTRGIFGLNVSSEYDYQSLGVSATLNFDTNQRNTTYTFGAGYNMDSVNPVGGAPVGLSYMPAPTEDEHASQGGNLSKDVYDIMLGVTQVLTRKDLLQVNLGYGNESGYLTDPYKIVSIVDSSGNLITPPVGALPYVYEKRPGDRTRETFYTRWSHQFNQDVLRLAYRYYTDDWGIKSHTIDAHYRWEFGSRSFLEPHVRYYTQTAADFYNTSLLNTELSSTTYASADYRLAEMTSTTIGLKYGMEVGKNSELGVRLESITQQATPSRVIGVQSSQDLVPDVNALLFQVSYSFKF